MELMSEPAVVTAVADAGPRDRLLTFFTRGRGGVRLYVKRPPRRGGTTLFIEPLQGGELVFSTPREGGRARLHSFVPQRVWPGIRADLDRSLHAIAFFELLTICLAEGEPQPELFALLVAFLDRLESERRPGLARAVATLRLLALSGFSPHVEGCVGCRAALDAGTGALLAPEAGGLVCRPCSAGSDERLLPVSPGALGFMRHALSLPSRQAGALRASKMIERELLRLLDRFVEARTGAHPRAGEAIERMEAAS